MRKAWDNWKVIIQSNGKWRVARSALSEQYARELAREYNRSGYEAYASNSSTVKRNPARIDLRNNIEVKRAAKLYKAFTGKSAPAPRKLLVPSVTKAGVVFGTMFGVGYISERDGKPYQHTFRAKSRPLLIASSDGKSVLIFGGRFAFTDRGIVDK